MTAPEAAPQHRAEERRAARARTIAARLQNGDEVSNRQFDGIYPPAIREMSSSYWTPIRVALRAARLLVCKPGARVLDIGSGAGKFCCIGAASTSGAFHGVEQRSALVGHARNVAGLLGVPRATFTCGPFDALAPDAYDGFYLFNPFEENEDRSLAAADRPSAPGDDWFRDDVRRAQAFLSAARAGARVVTYNGIGGAMPAAYALVARERMRRALELWIKRG